jgi:hypothetical protein
VAHEELAAQKEEAKVLTVGASVHSTEGIPLVHSTLFVVLNNRTADRNDHIRLKRIFQWRMSSDNRVKIPARG